jgi:DNA-binding response OmpR family regulator
MRGKRHDGPSRRTVEPRARRRNAPPASERTGRFVIGGDRDSAPASVMDGDSRQFPAAMRGAHIAMPALILLVDADRVLLRRIDERLSEAGYLVAAVSTFNEAKRLLDSVSPDLLIVGVRLDAFNGLHLAVRSRIEHPLLPVIVTNASADPLLEAETLNQGAEFIAKPLEHPEFLSRVKEAVERRARQQQPIRRWTRKHVAGVIEAELAARPARIFDVSYGGLRLAFGAERPVPDQFEVSVPDAGITVKARPVWAYRSPTTDEFWCGAELIDTLSPEMSGWRAFVDAT